MRTTAFATAIFAALGIMAASVAFADSERLNVPAAEWKSTAESKDRVVAAGYTVREIETDDGAYEVEVVDKDGVHAELYVHPATGEILRGYED
jgi:hypothetical protein